jgi:4-nitrophenyl phosphatase
LRQQIPDNERNSARIAARLSRAKEIVLDMDDTLVLGERRNEGLRALPDDVEFLAYLKSRGTPFVLITNGVVRSMEAYVDELRHAGLHAEPERIMTPATVTALYFSAKGYKRIIVLGGHGVSGPLANTGFDKVREQKRENVDAIFVGWFYEFACRTSKQDAAPAEAALKCLPHHWCHISPRPKAEPSAHHVL